MSENSNIDSIVLISNTYFKCILTLSYWATEGEYTVLNVYLQEIVNLIRRQKSKSTDLMNIPVFIYKF